jgi:hypothetical protein
MSAQRNGSTDGVVESRRPPCRSGSIGRPRIDPNRPTEWIQGVVRLASAQAKLARVAPSRWPASNVRIGTTFPLPTLSCSSTRDRLPIVVDNPPRHVDDCDAEDARRR